MMAAAGRYFLIRTAIVSATCLALLVGYRRARDRSEASARLEQMWTANLDALPDLTPRLDPYREQVNPALVATERDGAAPARRKLVAGVLLYRHRPTVERAAALCQMLPGADPDAVAAIASGLAAHPEQAGIASLWATARDEHAEPPSASGRRPRWTPRPVLRGLGGDRSGGRAGIGGRGSRVDPPMGRAARPGAGQSSPR